MEITRYLFKESVVYSLHFAPFSAVRGPQFSLGLHFTPGLQSAVSSIWEHPKLLWIQN